MPSPLDRASIIDLNVRNGGSTFVGGSPKRAERFSRYTAQVAKDIRSYYTLGFYPDVIDEKTTQGASETPGCTGHRRSSSLPINLRTEPKTSD
jgi:hypothetical protein